MPIKGILVESNSTIPSCGLKDLAHLKWVGCMGFVTKTWPSMVFCHGLWYFISFYSLRSYYACKMMGQFEPFGSFRTVRFHRFIGPTAGLGGLWLVQCLNGLIGWIGPDWRPVDGWTGRSGPVFKTLIKSMLFSWFHHFIGRKTI